MVRLRKKYQGQEAVFGVSTSDAQKLNVRLIELNGVSCNSGRCFRANHIDKVTAWLRTVEITEEFCVKYKIHNRIEQNPPKKAKKQVYTRLRVQMLHLEKWNIVTKSFRRIASSPFANLLRAQMHGLDYNMKYQIVEGGVKWANIPNNQLAKAHINGLVIADTTYRVPMRGVNNKSKAVARSQRK